MASGSWADSPDRRVARIAPADKFARSRIVNGVLWRPEPDRVGGSCYKRTAEVPISMRTHWVVVVAALAGAGCAGKLEDVVRLQASQDLACPARDVEVYDRRSDNYVRDFTVEIQEDLHSPILSNPNLDLPGCRPDRTSPTDGEKLKEIRILQIIGHR